MFCSPPGRASAQLGAGRAKILRLAFQVTTASQEKKTPLFVFTSAPPATGQLLSRLITQPRAWLGRVRNLIHSPQKYIRVTEIREDTHSTLRGQSCRSTPRANANERNANTATGTSIPNFVTNIHGAAK